MEYIECPECKGEGKFYNGDFSREGGFDDGDCPRCQGTGRISKPATPVKVRSDYQQFMQGFPHSSYPISEKCLCEKWHCKWYQAYEEPPDIKQFPIGWCKRFEPDPDAGYVMANQLPPCVLWAVERKPDKKATEEAGYEVEKEK